MLFEPPPKNITQFVSFFFIVCASYTCTRRLGGTFKYVKNEFEFCIKRQRPKKMIRNTMYIKYICFWTIESYLPTLMHLPSMLAFGKRPRLQYTYLVKDNLFLVLFYPNHI